MAVLVPCLETVNEMYRAQVGYPIGFFYGYKTALESFRTKPR